MGASSGDDEDLTDVQIKQLLKNAEDRLTRLAPMYNTAKGASVVETVSESSLLRPPKLKTCKIAQPYVTLNGAIARVDPSRLLDNRQRQLSGKPRKVEDPVIVKCKINKTKNSTAGTDWYNLPRTNLTPDLKRDLQLLRMRSVLDPKRHYKKDNGKAKAPEFSQVGTIFEGPTEFYSARLLNKERKRTLVDEVLAGKESLNRFKSKYDDIQSAKTSGKKAHYRALKEERSRGIPR